MSKRNPDPFAPPRIDPKELERADRELGVERVPHGTTLQGQPFVVATGPADAAERLARRRTAELN